MLIVLEKAFTAVHTLSLLRVCGCVWLRVPCIGLVRAAMGQTRVKSNSIPRQVTPSGEQAMTAVCVSCLGRAGLSVGESYAAP